MMLKGTVSKNNIGAPKRRNKYGAIKSLIFSIAPCQGQFSLLKFWC